MKTQGYHTSRPSVTRQRCSQSRSDSQKWKSASEFTSSEMWSFFYPSTTHGCTAPHGVVAKTEHRAGSLPSTRRQNFKYKRHRELRKEHISDGYAFHQNPKTLSRRAEHTWRTPLYRGRAQPSPHQYDASKLLYRGPSRDRHPIPTAEDRRADGVHCAPSNSH